MQSINKNKKDKLLEPSIPNYDSSGPKDDPNYGSSMAMSTTETERRPGEVWRTGKGRWAAKSNKTGETEYFSDKKAAERFLDRELRAPSAPLMKVDDPYAAPGQEPLKAEPTSPEKLGKVEDPYGVDVPSTPTKKSPAIDNFLKKTMGIDRKAAVSGKVCALCNKPVTSFKDPESAKEFQISGMCQSCQDSVFGGDDEDLTQQYIDKDIDPSDMPPDDRGYDVVPDDEDSYDDDFGGPHYDDPEYYPPYDKNPDQSYKVVPNDDPSRVIPGEEPEEEPPPSDDELERQWQQIHGEPSDAEWDQQSKDAQARDWGDPDNPMTYADDEADEGKMTAEEAYQHINKLKEALNRLKEKSPAGWEKTVKSMKKYKDIDNPWALAHWMKNKGWKSHKEIASIDEKLPPPKKRPGTVWQTSNGKWGSRDIWGRIRYSDTEEQARANLKRTQQKHADYKGPNPRITTWPVQVVTPPNKESIKEWKEHGSVWKSTSGKFGAKNKRGRVKYFKEEIKAREFSTTGSTPSNRNNLYVSQQIGELANDEVQNISLSSLLERDYKREYQLYHSKPEQKKRRAQRNKDRRNFERVGKVRKGDGKDVHHRDGDPFNHDGKNVTIMDKSKNRSMKERGKNLPSSNEQRIREAIRKIIRELLVRKTLTPKKM